MKTNSTEGGETGSLFQGESWFDPLEAGVRGRIRGFIEAMLHEEVTAVLDRGRYERGAARASGTAPASASCLARSVR